MDTDEADCEDYLLTTEPYYTFQGEEFVQEEKDHVAEIMSHAEVPGEIFNHFEKLKWTTKFCKLKVEQLEFDLSIL